MGDEVVRINRDGGTAELVIARPKTLNSLSREVLTALLDAILPLNEDASLRCVLISGEGERAFAAGADIAAMAELDREGIASYLDLGQRVMRAVELLPVPVIAVVSGFALGGGLELALACDLIIASKRSKVGQPEVNLGIIPGFGGTQRLVHRCGLGTARRLVYTGEIIDSEEALRLGVVDEVVDGEKLHARAREVATTIGSKGPCAVRAAKRALREAVDPVLRSGLAAEASEFLGVFATADRLEGMRAFLEKRPPQFGGR